DSEDLSLADGTGMSPRLDSLPTTSQPKDRRAVFGILAGLAIVLLGVVAFAALNNARQSPTAAASNEPKVKMTVRPLDPEPAKEPVKQTKTAEPEPTPPPPDVTPEKPPTKDAKDPKDKRPKIKRKDPKDKDPKDVAVAPEPAVTADQLQNKVMQATREYREFKEKNGGRLEKDWGDLMTYVQFKKGSVEDRFRKVEEFRAKMKRE
ncbi:MAG TPA: hypothetical protein VIU61_06560, partial [Kofleriaceae bacterium]